MAQMQPLEGDLTSSWSQNPESFIKDRPFSTYAHFPEKLKFTS